DHSQDLPGLKQYHASTQRRQLRVHRVHPDRRRMGAPADLPDLRRNPLLRRLQKQARHQTLPPQRPPRRGLRRTRRTMAVVLRPPASSRMV
ncbi:MAG: conserved hypothetical protein, partial [uncultured Cytophagales bacterium]